MSEDVTTWLNELGLGQYAEAFAENAIDWTHLTDLDHDTLQAVGVKAVGHRMSILKAVASLSEDRAVDLPGDSPSADSNESLAAWERHPGERKPVTMLFADITGSTALTEKLDAEETHELLYGATQRMCAAVENNQGTVCRFMGDGVMAMFGAPVASEHHAVDACEAALEMQQAISDYAVDADAQGMQIRVGLHSGEVVVLTVGEGDKAEYDASGPTVPIAARLEQAAAAGAVYLSAATQRLAGERIDSDTLAPISVKGISSPILVFSLRRVKSIEETAQTKRTRFVGRRAELNQFTAILDTCIEDGRGQTVYVRGEAGIGKTRLIEEFVRIAAAKGVVSHRSLVLEFGAGKGQDAVRSLVRSLLGVPLGRGKADRAMAASDAVKKGLMREDQQVYLNDLLDLPQPLELRTLYDAMDNDTRNHGKQTTVSMLVARFSVESPLIVIIEDIHWADAVILSHLSMLAKAVADCPALLVMTSRIVGDPLDQSWRSGTEGAPFISIDLGPLRKEESMDLIGDFMSPDNPLADGCLERAAGNPLFLEQLLRSAEEGLEKALPDSIQSLILARIDRLLARDKEALQAAAVIGQRFDLDGLKYLLATPEYDCHALIDHNLVRPDGDAYLFAHALIQEGVYESLLKSVKAPLHLRAARWYGDDDPVLHAQHLERASDPSAPAAYLAAARFQAAAYRISQAMNLVERGLAIVESRSDKYELTVSKGELLLDLGRIDESREAFKQAFGYAVEDHQKCVALIGVAAVGRVAEEREVALDALEQAQSLAHEERHQLELARVHHLRGNLLFFTGKAEECLSEHGLALRFAKEAQSAELEAKALSGLGDAEFARGQMSAASDHWRRCVDLARTHGFGRIEVPNLGMLADASYCQNELQAATTITREAIELAKKTHDLRTECFLRWSLAYTLAEQAEWTEVHREARTGLELSRQIGARIFEAVSLIHLSLAEREIGTVQAAEDLSKEAVQIVHEMGTGFVGPWSLGILARVSQSSADRRKALQEGEAMLSADCVFFNYLHFCRHAIEACLEDAWWDETTRYCDLLESYASTRPTPFASFFVARGRALAAYRQGSRSETTVQEIRRLRDEAKSSGLRAALPALEDALSVV